MVGRVGALLTVAAATVAGLSGAAAFGSDVDGRVAFVVKQAKVDATAVRPLVGGRVQLIHVPSFQGNRVSVLSLAWAPRAERLALSDSAGRIYVGAGGSGLRRVAGPTSFGGRSVAISGWSPDGRTVAVEAWVPGCRAGEPGLFLVDADSGSVRRLPAHPSGAPAASAEHPAFIDVLDWSPAGSQLLYAWRQYDGGECRNMGANQRPALVLTIGVGGKTRREVARRYNVRSGVWSPSGRLVALASGCSGDEPFAWTKDERSVVIATRFDGCSVLIVDRQGGVKGKAELWPSSDSNGTVRYALDAANGKARILRTSGGIEYTAIGTMPDGRGVVARVYRDFDAGSRLALVPLDGSPPVPLATLKAPKGMTVGYLAAAGFTR